MDGRVVCDALPAYQEDCRLLLPLGALSRELGVAIEVTPATGRARGFVLRSSRPFELDVASARVAIAGRVSRLEPGSVELHDDDLFVDVRTLQSWLPADVEGTMQDGVLSLRSREAFPAQLRRARQLRSLAIVTADGGPAPDLPRLSAPYAFLSFPFVDQLRSVVQRVASPGQYRNLTSSQTHIAGDLLFVQAHLYVVSENVGRQPEIRMNLGRRDPEGRLLGPLGATEVAAGEIQDPGDPPIPDASLVMNGAGATVRTGADGTAFLLGLPSDQSVDVALAPGSLEDPTWSPVRPAVRFVPRAGRTQRLEFPVVISGEIVGTTSYRVGGTTRAAGGIPLELVSDPSGMVIQRIRSAFDGFFDITRVPPGRYTLRLAKAAASKYRLPPRHIVVDASGTLVDDVALVLEPAGNAATLR